MTTSLEKTLNKLKAISETLNSVPMFADYNWDGNKKIYYTKLSQLSEEVSNGLAPINQNRKEKALLKWSKYLENEIKQEEFSIKEIEILSFEPKVILSDLFWDILLNASNITFKMIIGVLYATHRSWTTINNLESILSSIQTLILNNDFDNRIVRFWKENMNIVSSIQTPKLLADECINNAIGIAEVSKKYMLSLEGTELATIIQQKILEERLERYIKNNAIGIDETKHITEEINQTIFIKDMSNFYYNLLIQAVNSSKIHRHDSKEYLKDYFLNNIDYNDPRKKPEKWLNFDETGKNIIIAWLNEQDIKIFFDLFVGYDPHDRRYFWLKYANRIKKIKIIQCPTLYQNIKNKEKIDDLIKKGHKFIKLIGAQTNAFILEFENYTIVEFSENGNACYIYKKDDIQFNKNVDNTISIYKLKDQYKAINKITHNKNWQYELTNWLAQKGIRP